MTALAPVQDQKNELQQVVEQGMDELRGLMAELRESASDSLKALKTEVVKSEEMAKLAYTKVEEKITQTKKEFADFITELKGEIDVLKGQLRDAIKEGNDTIESLNALKSYFAVEKARECAKKEAEEIAELMAKSWMSVKVIAALQVGYMMALLSALFGKVMTPQSHRACHEFGFYFKCLAGAVWAFAKKHIEIRSTLWATNKNLIKMSTGN